MGLFCCGTYHSRMWSSRGNVSNESIPGSDKCRVLWPGRSSWSPFFSCWSVYWSCHLVLKSYPSGMETADTGSTRNTPSPSIAMLNTTSPFLWAAVIALVCILIIIKITARTTSRPTPGLRSPPGPKGLPVIGNIHQLSGRYPHQTFRRWAKIYGEVFQVRLGYYNTVFLCSPNAVKEILDRQAQSTSGRPPMPVLSDLVSGGKRFLLMRNTGLWRQLRGIVHRLLTPKASEGFRRYQEGEARALLWDVWRDCGEKAKGKGDGRDEGEEVFYRHVRRYSTSVMMRSVYGVRVPGWVSFLVEWLVWGSSDG
jgi:hypothetical protein